MGFTHHNNYTYAIKWQLETSWSPTTCVEALISSKSHILDVFDEVWWLVLGCVDLAWSCCWSALQAGIVCSFKPWQLGSAYTPEPEAKERSSQDHFNLQPLLAHSSWCPPVPGDVLLYAAARCCEASWYRSHSLLSLCDVQKDRQHPKHSHKRKFGHASGCS